MLQPVPIAGPAAEIAAWWRLVELCLPSHEACGALTFAPAGAETLEADWEQWLAGLFLPVIHPALADLQSAAAAQDAARVLSADAALGRSLPPAAARSSLAAGRHLLLAFQPPQSARLLDRLRAAAATDPTVGQVTAVFAVRGRTFHLPFLQVAGALLLAECVLGADAAGLTLPAPRTTALLQGALDRMAALPPAQLLAV